MDIRFHCQIWYWHPTCAWPLLGGLHSRDESALGRYGSFETGGSWAHLFAEDLLAFLGELAGSVCLRCFSGELRMQRGNKSLVTTCHFSPSHTFDMHKKVAESQRAKRHDYKKHKRKFCEGGDRKNVCVSAVGSSAEIKTTWARHRANPKLKCAPLLRAS